MIDTIFQDNWRNFFSGAYYDFATLPSTQQYLRNHSPLPRPIFCQALNQTAGEGQRGRQWQSTQTALTFSIRITLPDDMGLHQGLTQALALTLVTTLDPDADYLRLKWPNDIFYRQRKLAGILVEGQTNSKRLDSEVIIGIGINIADQTSCKDYAYWQEISPSDSRETLLERIMPRLIHCLEQWAQHPYLPIDHRWQDYDLFNKEIVMLEGQKTATQIFGIDQKGRLICRETNKKLHYLTNTRILTRTLHKDSTCTFS
ncbi:MAG: biotin--[acetyl-CoA-carboxylase] ligase [Cardiobacteriales bacterium]|nr:MAG: biotin--[acetyl-CoA-carboxylase] ligase [Cardiobacteriales bacterium]